MGKPERFALAVQDGDLAWHESKHKPIEFVAALSAASRLGSDIHRAKDNDLAAIRRAVLLLTSKAIKAGQRNRIPLSRDMAQLMAACAIIERCHPHCRKCHGAAVVIVDKLKIECPSCGGIGIHRYSDRERAKLCGVGQDEWGKWSRRYQMVLSILIGNDTATKLAGERLG